jgi:hypothetical protein
MGSQLFDVVFFGILQPGKNKETVVQNMARLFKTDAKKIAPYFTGGRKIIKREINADSAEKYRTALENAGLVIKIEACKTTQDDASKEQSQAKINTAAIDTSNMSLAPVGANIAANPVATPAQEIDDISDISMAEVGADVLPNPVNVPAQKINDISKISLADPGADVLDQPVQVIPQKIDDITDLTLADAGVDIIENPKPKVKVNLPDTSELSLSDEKS